MLSNNSVMKPESLQLINGGTLKSGDLPTDADELFAALDGQIVSSGNLRWEMRIWGIHLDAGRLWLQIAFLGSRSFAGTIAVSPTRD